MWKKEDEQDPVARDIQPQKPMTTPNPVPSKPAAGERATIGRSITIKGEVSGDEDLLIQGTVDGSVNLEQQTVTVGKEGKVKADITGRVVTVEGEVEGNLKAEEQVVLRSSARVQGDIWAPRVVLEDGGVFRGGIDMGEPVSKEKPATAKPSAAPSSDSASSGATSSGASSGATSSGASSSAAASSAGGSSGSEKKAKEESSVQPELAAASGSKA
jgi:cytoskeletal protein CcmA (bactofilin family)